MFQHCHVTQWAEVARESGRMVRQGVKCSSHGYFFSEKEEMTEQCDSQLCDILEYHSSVKLSRVEQGWISNQTATLVEKKSTVPFKINVHIPLADLNKPFGE